MRDVVLFGEVSFWAGTVIGVTALVLGIVATALGAGRGAAITAIVVSAIGPLVFTGLVAVGLVAGLASAAAVSTSV